MTHPPPSLHFRNRATTTTDLTGRLNVTTAVALAPWPPTKLLSSIHLFISYTLLIFDKQNCIFLMYVGCLAFIFILKRKKKVWKFVKSRDVLFCPSNTDLAIVFFLTRWLKLVRIYCQDVNDNYDHLFTRCTRCPPACLCVHERSVDSMTGRRTMRWYPECDCYNVECFFFFLIHQRLWQKCLCVFMCACFWIHYLPQSGKWIKLTACVRKECMCVCENTFVC